MASNQRHVPRLCLVHAVKFGLPRLKSGQFRRRQIGDFLLDGAQFSLRLFARQAVGANRLRDPELKLAPEDPEIRVAQTAPSRNPSLPDRMRSSLTGR
jgi:hypothetical protein